MENKQEKDFNTLLFETKLSMFGLEYLGKLQEEINKVDASNCSNECEFEAKVAWCEGLRKSIEIFTELIKKNKQ